MDKSELEVLVEDIIFKVHDILEKAQKRGVRLDLYPKLALVIVKKELPKKIQKHKLMEQINMRQLIIFVLTKMGIDVTGKINGN